MAAPVRRNQAVVRVAGSASDRHSNPRIHAGIPVTERRRSRTDRAVGYTTAQVLKSWSSGPAARTLALRVVGGRRATTLATVRAATNSRSAERGLAQVSA